MKQVASYLFTSVQQTCIPDNPRHPHPAQCVSIIYATSSI